MSLRVHRIAFSTNVERVALALAYKGVDVTWVEVDPADRAPVVTLTGQGLVPVLEAPDVVIADSTAILRWLEAQTPEPALWPQDAAARATTDIAIDWFNTVWKHAPNAIEAELEQPEPDAAVVARLSAEIQETLPRFEALLAGRDFLLGDTLGAFDLIAFPFLKYAVVVPEPDDVEPFHWILHDHLQSGAQLPGLAGWIARIDALPRA